MASEATSSGKLRKQGLGDGLSTWGLTNGINGVFDALDDAVFGIEAMSLTGNKTLTTVSYATDNEIAPRVHRLTDGGLSAAPTLTIPATANWWFVNNATAYAVTYDNGSNSASVAASSNGLVWTDGTSVYSLNLFTSADQTFVGGLSYTFSTTTTDADPGAGFLRLDNATQASATGIYVSDTDGTAADVSAWLLTWDDSTSTIPGFITIRSKSDTSKYRVFSITSLTDNAGYMDFTIANVAGSGSFSDGEAIYITFARTGDKGDTGATGATGTATAAGEPTATDSVVPLRSSFYLSACFGG